MASALDPEGARHEARKESNTFYNDEENNENNDHSSDDVNDDDNDDDNGSKHDGYALNLWGDDENESTEVAQQRESSKPQIPFPPSTIITAPRTAHAADGIPTDNRVYSQRDYWDSRFRHEEEYEWLVAYNSIRAQLTKNWKKAASILVLGCGNSTLSADLYDDGYTNVTSIDYSSVVIDRMIALHSSRRPELMWLVMDMTDMSDLGDASYDIVLDKAAMDAIMTQEGDVWNPCAAVVEQSRKTCRQVSRVLKPNGYFLQISFAQPHFRRKYLLGLHHPPTQAENAGIVLPFNSPPYSLEYGWTYSVEDLIPQNGTAAGCFTNFLYVMQKVSPMPCKP